MTPNPMSNPMPAPPPQQKKGGVSAVVIIAVVVALACPCVGILAAIAIPNFIKFQAKAKQSEAKSNLKAAFAAEQAFFAGADKYSADIEEVGFSPMPGNRYMYSFSTEGELAEAGGTKGSGVKADSKKFPTIDNDAIEKGVPQEIWADSGIEGECPSACSITIVAAGNIDNDDTIDVWTVSTKERVIGGISVPAGVPHNDVNDLTD